MRKCPFAKFLSLTLIAALFACTVPAQGWAMPVPAERAAVRSQDLAKVQATLESTAIRQRLLDFGLTADEAAARLTLLSDAQVHQLAADLDAVQAGGGIIGDVVVILVIVAVVIVVLQLTGHRVIMHR